MADMTITGDAKFGSIVTEMQKVEKASDSMKRKVDNMSRGAGTPAKGGHHTSGMGILEISRGVEDFAVAGMRGLMNNIPGIIMSLGGGMGLAGVVSLAAVAFSAFGKEILSVISPTSVAADELARFKASAESVTSSLNKMRDAKAAKAIAADISLLNKQAQEWIDTTLGFNPDPTGAFGINEQEIESARKGADEIKALSDKLAEIQSGKEQGGILDLGVKRTEEDIARLEKLVSDLNERGPKLSEMLGADKSATFGGIDAVTNKLILAQSAVAGYEAQIKELESQMGGFGNTVKEYAIDFAALYLSGKENPAAEMAATRKQMGLTLPETNIGNRLGVAKGELWAAEQKKKALEDQLKLEEAAIANGVTVKDQYEKEMRSNQASLESAKSKLKSAKEQLATEKEKFDIMEKIRVAELSYSKTPLGPSAEEWRDFVLNSQYSDTPLGPSSEDFRKFKQDQAEELAKRFAAIDTKLSGMGIGGSDMLSSSGRIGGSVKEYNSAIATINYQRDTLKELRAIARNTARKQLSPLN
jgi:hypothetical protein